MLLVAGNVDRPEVHDCFFRRVRYASPDNTDQAQHNQDHSGRSVHGIKLSNPVPNPPAVQGARKRASRCRRLASLREFAKGGRGSG